MKKILIVAAWMIASAACTASEFSGKIVEGGGIDFQFIEVEAANGKRLVLYCGECGDWFDHDPEIEGERLKKSLYGRKIKVTYSSVRNRGQYAGPADDDMVQILKRAKLLP